MIESHRFIDNQLQTPIFEFQHPGTRGTVALIGTVHFGTPDYYDEINKYVAKREKIRSAIQYEGFSQGDTSELNPATQKIIRQRNRAFSSGVGGVFSVLHRGLGLVYQSQALRPKDTWERPDTNHIEFALQGMLVSTKTEARAARLLGTALRFTPSCLTRPMATSMLKLIVEKDYSHDPGMLQDDQRPGVLYRNDIALAAVDAERSRKPGGDVTMLWGYAHVPDLVEGIEERRYIQTNERWLTAFELS